MNMNNAKNQLTPVQVQKFYDTSLDSVTLINKLVAKPKTAASIDSAQRNMEHLKLMLAKTWWTGQDLTPFQTAVKVATDWLALP